MNFRIVVAILLTVILTLFFIANDQSMEIRLLDNTIRISKAILLPSLSLIGFLIGYILGHIHSRSLRRKKDLREAAKKPELGTILNEEDRKYLNG